MEKEKNKGITLIALIMTIIVTLIIVGVSVPMLLGDNGIIEKTVASKEEAEMADLLDKANTIKAKLQGQEAKGGPEVTRDSLLDAINDELGQKRENYKVISKDGKYDILVDKNLNITVKKHDDNDVTEPIEPPVEPGEPDGGGGPEEPEPPVEPELPEEPEGPIEKAPLFIPVVTEYEEWSSIDLYLNVEQYYSDLIENAIVEYYKIVADENLSSFAEVRQMLSGGAFPDKLPEEITTTDIILYEDLGNSPENFFITNGGALLNWNTDEDKRRFMMEFWRYVLSLQDATDDEILQYISESFNLGVAPEDMTNDDLVYPFYNFNLYPLENPSMEEFWNILIDEIMNRSFYNDPFYDGFMNAITPTVLDETVPDLKIEAIGKFSEQSLTYYTVNETQTCKFIITANNDRWEFDIDIVINTKYYTETLPFEDKNKDIIWIPEGFKVVDENATAIGGFAIRDKLGSYFVWIPVSSTDYTNMFNTSTKKGKLYNFSKTGTASYKGTETIASSDQSYFNAMMDSVKKYGGFYVARSETCLRDSTGSAVIQSWNAIAALKRNATFNEWFEASKRLSTNSTAISTHMIWDCQWDQVMKFVHNAKAQDGSVYNVGKGLADRHRYVLSAGNHTSDKVKGIFDLEGSTKEFTSSGVIRGGADYILNEISFLPPASYRDTAASADKHGSRISMYINVNATP